MNIEKVFRRSDILEILHHVLEDERTKQKLGFLSPDGETDNYNQYSLLIVVDFLIKSQIIINDIDILEKNIPTLKTITSGYATHKELVVCLNELLGDLTRQKLGYPDAESELFKEGILQYVYDQYIVNGYLFHSFPSAFKKEVEEIGLDPTAYRYPVYEMKQISYIFSHHHYPDMITKDLKQTSPLYMTDSPAMAYFYAFRAPSYFCDLTATSKYYDKAIYDQEAYYRKDKNACRENLQQLCRHVRMTEKEERTVMKAFRKQWNLLNASQSKPVIAFIERKEIGKDKLPDSKSLLEEALKLPLAYGIARITDSKYREVRCYSPVDPLSFTTVTMPSYREIKNNQLLLKKKPKPKEDLSKEDLEAKETKIPLATTQPARAGYTTVVFLFGLLFISIGITVSIILKFYGIGG